MAVNALQVLAAAASATFKPRAALHLIALRHQLGVLHRSVKRPKLTPPDRLLWAWLSAVWGGWRAALVIVEPETVIAWPRKGFRLCRMSRENPLWGAPRIHGELRKLGIQGRETSVGKYRQVHGPPSQTARRVSSTLRHPAWEFTDYLPSSFRRMTPAC